MDQVYHAHAFDGALAVIYNPGTKENAGIFSQTQGWLILAEALRGQGQRAYTYFAENAPAAQNDRAEVRHLEPYCYGQFTEGPASKHFGRSQVHWLTGTASTVMVGCVEGILGLRPDLDGLRLAPAIPREWTGFTMDKDFRGCRLHIRVENPHHRESGFTSLTVNGRELPDAYIPAALLTRETEVCLILWLATGARAGLACAPSIFNERFSPYNHSGRHIFMPPAVRFSIGCGNSARQGLSGPAGGLPHPSCVGASGSDSMFHSTI